MAALSDRIEAHNYSMDPWECTGAAPQGWATHLQQSIMPVQGYLHLRPSNLNSVPEFGAPPTDSSAVVPVKEKSKQEMTSRQGRASKPVSIFARAPVCSVFCTYCKACPCRRGHEAPANSNQSKAKDDQNIVQAKAVAQTFQQASSTKRWRLPNGCSKAKAGESCSKGIHLCAEPGCFKPHSLQDHR